MKNGLIIFLLLFLLNAVNVSSQSIQVSGQILDAQTYEPLPYANMLFQDSIGSISDINGNYTVEINLKNREAITVKIFYTGYEPYSDTIAVQQDAMHIDIFLNLSKNLLDQVVISASRYNQSVSEAIVSLDIIKPELGLINNDVTLDETLERSSGVSIIDGQPNIRGGSGYSYGAGSRVLLLMNGLPILTGDAGFPTWSYIPIENTGNIEVIKGASSVLYGSSALNGIINFQTAKAASKAYGKVSVFSGFYGTPPNNMTSQVDTVIYDIIQGDTIAVDSVFKQKKWWSGKSTPYFLGANISYRKKIGQLDLVAGGYYFKEQSFRKDEFFHGGRVNINTLYKFKNIKGLSVSLNFNSLINSSASFFLWEDDQSGAYKPMQNTVTQNRGFRMNIDPTITWYSPKGDKHQFKGRYFKADNRTDANQTTLSDLLYGEYQFQKKLQTIGLIINAGITGTYSFVDAELYNDTTHSWKNMGLYVQIEKKFFNRLNLLAGMRYEQNKINQMPTEKKPVFRFGLNYKLAPYTFLRASFGQGYRYPTIAEMFVRTDVGIISIYPNPALKSETGWSTEVGIKQGFKINNWSGMADLAFFVNAYQNMMEFSFGGTDGTLFGFQSVNIGNTNISGMEITLAGEGKIGKFPLNIIFGYTYINPVYADFDSATEALSSADYNVLKYRFRHTVKINLESDLKHWQFGISGRYYSFMEAIDKVFEVLIPGVQDFRKNNAHGAFVFDLSIGFHYAEKGTISLIVKNSLNTEYSLRPALMEAPRNYTLKVTQEF
jgi:outer membrane receptor protein involved in Fe transport